MIASLRGELFSKAQDKLIVDVGGVGYEVYFPATGHAFLPETGHDIFLYIYTVVREDAINLYGFITPEEKDLFVLLIGVSGVGPKLAVNILSGMKPREFSRAIASGNILQLTKLSGVGRKTAERLCLELKDKIYIISGLETQDQMSAVEEPDDQLSVDVVSALVNLGYPRYAARNALENVRRQLSEDEYRALGFEELIRQSLRSLA